MKSSLSIMAVAGILSLAFFGTTASAYFCEDDPDFLFKKKNGRNCAWVAGSKNPAMRCAKKKAFRKNCPKTCQTCPEPITVCPKNRRKMMKKFDKGQCDDYETGLQCSYDGKNEEFECTETGWVVYAVSDDPPITTLPITVCPPTREEMLEVFEDSLQCDSYQTGLQCSYKSTEQFECTETGWVAFAVSDDPPVYTTPPITTLPITVCPPTREEMLDVFELMQCDSYQIGLECSYKSTEQFECTSEGWIAFAVSDDPPVFTTAPPVTTDPIKICPPTKEEMEEVYNMEQCLSYQTGLFCSYEESQILYRYACTDEGWSVGPPLLTTEPPVTTDPITVCPPTKEEMEEVYDMEQCLSYQFGLRCSYEESPNEFYECTEEGWLFGVSDPEPPITTDPITVCPPTKEEMEDVYDMEQCDSYQLGLRCSYEESPEEFYDCTAGGWLLFRREPPITTLPITVCPPTKEEMEVVYDMEQCYSYQTGLRCSYKESPNEFYECTASEGWLFGVSDPEPEPITVCPETENDMIQVAMEEGCDSYQPNLRCRYETAPNKFWQCFQGEGEGWSLAIVDPEPPVTTDPITVCPETYEEMEQVADMKQCDSYEAGLVCRYESPSNIFFECNKFDLEWVRVIDDGPGFVVDPPVTDGPCDAEPEEGSSCDSSVDGSCLAGYAVQGCSPETLFCSAGVRYTCSAKGGVWTKEFLPQIKCYNPDPILGTPCSPDGCPPAKPKAGKEGCSLGDGDEICYYDYQVLGCTSESLQCQPNTSFKCDEKNRWLEEPIFRKACVADDPRWGKDCSPFGCPVQKPKPGGACTSNPDPLRPPLECDYDFRYEGCTPETLACVGTTGVICLDDVWIGKVRAFPTCIAKDTRAGKACDPDSK